MYRALYRSSFYFCSAVVAPQPLKKIAEQEETGWDRVAKIFKRDEYNTFSPELAEIYQTTVLTAFFGACYGGFIHSRDAYLSFIERNEAAKFTDHFEAKKKLQDHVTLNFGKGALRWSWRIALFGGLYTTFVTVLGAYRGEKSVLDYTLGGFLSGFIYRINYGLNGVVVGGTLGSFIGLMAGSLTMMILRVTGTSFDDISEWHKQQLDARERHLKEAVDKSLIGDGQRELLAEHDGRINAS